MAPGRLRARRVEPAGACDAGRFTVSFIKRRRATPGRRGVTWKIGQVKRAKGDAMLEAISALKGYAIEASDGRIGTVSDFLFDDETWRVRWLVVDTGTWLTERKVLIHPSAIERADYEHKEFDVTLSKAQVEGSPGILEDRPVSLQMQRQLYDYYGWTPYTWGGNYLGANSGAIAAPFSGPPYFRVELEGEAAEAESVAHGADPHLRSIAEVTGYHVHAVDGDIGHVENFIVGSATWAVRYLVIDTRNWWPGKHVLMSPYAVEEINWFDHQVRLKVTRDQVKASPPWNPLDLMDQAELKRLHAHYGWPGFGV